MEQLSLFPEPARNSTTGEGAKAAPILVRQNQEKPQTEVLEKYAVAVRCSCSSVWCPKCYRKYFAGRQSERMQRLDWTRTRMVTLTLNPANWCDGEDAYMWFKLHKPIGYFIENLGRAGIKVNDWTCNMEWHDGGFPHWHLLIEVDKPGRYGMIGQELLHKLWNWGEVSHRIHETYFRTEKQFKKFTGYFSKTGYLHKDKQHQMILPGWASGRGWAGLKINRFSSKRFPAAKKAEEQSPPEPENRFSHKLTYAVKHSRCGNQVEIWEVEVFGSGHEKKFSRSKIGLYRVPYQLVIDSLSGEFYQGLGYSFEGTTAFVCGILQAWEKSPPTPSPKIEKEFRPAKHHYWINVMRERHFYGTFGGHPNAF